MPWPLARCRIAFDRPSRWCIGAEGGDDATVDRRVRDTPQTCERLNAWRDLSVRGRLSASQGAARPRGQRSRPDATEEHRRADPRLFAPAAEPILTKVLSLAPNNAWAHYWSGFVQINSHRAAEGIAECERALALDPNLARAHALMGVGKIFSGRPEETEPHVKEALRLSPGDDFAFHWMLTAGAAKLHLRVDEEAVVWLGRSIERDRNWPLAHFFLAAALANLGRLKDAEAATHAGLALDPTFTIRRFQVGAATANPRFMSTREHFYAGMRKAGVPEQ